MRVLFLIYSLFSLLLGEIHSRRFGTPEGIRIPDLPLRSSPDTTSGSETQYKKILGNTRFFTVFNPFWYYAS